MKTAQAKLITWSAAGVLCVGLAGYMLYVVRLQAQTRQMVDAEKTIRPILEGVADASEAKAHGPIAYSDPKSAYDVKRSWVELNWIGKAAEAVVEQVEAPPPPKPVEQSVARLVRVLAIYLDPASSEETKCILKYSQTAGVTAPEVKAGTVAKKVGDRLDPPHESIRIVQIDGRGVEFAYDDPARDREILKPAEYDLGGRLVQVGEGGAVMLPPTEIIPRASAYGTIPQRTVRIGQNSYRVGTEDAEYINQNFDRILTDEVRVEPHRDPRTGKRDGIEIREIKPGSLVESHGGQAGDVIKSINGHAVKSSQEAIQFVKTNAKIYDKWEVVVENKGQERTITIYPPPPKD